MRDTKRIFERVANCVTNACEIGATTRGMAAELGLTVEQVKQGLARLRRHNRLFSVCVGRCNYYFPTVERCRAGAKALEMHVSDEDDFDDLIPRADPDEIVAAAVMSRTPLELAWSAA